MISLVYVSEASTPFSDEQLTELLRLAQTNNSARSITGLLLHSNNKFVQALEGPKEQVWPLYEKIRADQRHKNVRLLRREDIGRREFWAWSMAFFTIDPKQYQDLPAFADLFSKPYCADFALCTPGESNRLLRQFHRAFAPAVPSVQSA